MRGLACTVIATGAVRTPAALVGARAAGSLFRRRPKDRCEPSGQGALRRADLQPYLGPANIVTDLVRGSGGAWFIVTDLVRGS